MNPEIRGHPDADRSEVTGVHSVIPQRSNISKPSFSLARRHSASGRLAPPDIARRIEEKSHSFVSLKFINMTYMVGTPIVTVTFRSRMTSLTSLG